MGKVQGMTLYRPIGWKSVLLTAMVAYGLSLTLLILAGAPPALWFTNGAITVILMSQRQQHRAGLILVAGAAIGAATFTAGSGAFISTIYALANMAQLTLVALAIQRFARARAIPGLHRLGLLAMACMAAPLAPGMLVATIIPSAPWTTIFTDWVIGNGLMLLVAMSLTLAFRDNRASAQANRWVEALAAGLLVAVVTAYIFTSALPQLSFLMPLLLIAAVRLGPRQAMSVAMIGGVVAAVLTSLGHGPIAATTLSAHHKSLLLLVFVAVTLCLTLPVSVISRERAELERRLRATARQFRLLAETSPGGVIHYDLSGRIQFMNARWSALTGTTIEDVTSEGWPIALPPTERARAHSWWSQARHEGKDGFRTLPCNICGRDEGWADIYILPEREAGGTLVGWVVKLLDVTDRIEASRKLNEALDEAKAATEAKSAFLATMSHEIRTPMTGVLGMIELLEDDLSLAERRSYLGTLKQSADLLMTVINDVLDFSKLEYGPPRLECSNVDLERIARSTVELFANSASRKGLLITLSVDDSTPPLAHADPVRLQQVVSNLVSNAIKFTDRGTIAIAICHGGEDRIAGGHRWRFEVRDTGIGIDPADRAALFQPFVQAQIGNMRPYGGTGLGLAISRNLVLAMGGEIGVDSIPGQGSTFWFEVPLASATGPVDLVDDPPAVPADTRALHVLVAEDNAVNQMLVTALLRRAGHEPTCVANGQEAVEAFAAASFDCVLMDMQMPVMDGIGATRAIRKMGEAGLQVPIIALSADASPERRRFYDQAGLTDFLTKPIDSVQLAARLASIAAGVAAIDPAPCARTDLLDEDYLESLEQSLGQDRLTSLVELFLSELDTRPAQIERHLLHGELADASSLAHSLKGAALSTGASALAKAAIVIEEWVDPADHAGLRAAATDLAEVVRATRLALQARIVRQNSRQASA